MKAKEITALTTAEMLDKEKQYKEELFNLRFQQATGQLENTARLSQVRKTLHGSKRSFGNRHSINNRKGDIYLGRT